MYVEDGIKDEDFKQLERVQSYLEVNLDIINREEISALGVPVEGSNPIWNQTRNMKIATSAKKKINFATLERQENKMKLYLFDEITKTRSQQQNVFKSIVTK